MNSSNELVLERAIAGQAVTPNVTNFGAQGRFEPPASTPPQSKAMPPLFEIPWLEDRQFRMNPAVMTLLLREQVPVLETVDWRVAEIEPGLAETVLPLNPPSTNQHFTHQAALFVLAADYTGGLAVSSLIHGWPIVGVHPVTSARSISLWLAKAEIKYLRPSVGDLVVRAVIPETRHDRIRKRFADGRSVVESVNIECFNGAVRVAEACLTYFMRQSDQFRLESINPEKPNILYQLKLASSAEMIAGVRARENGHLFDDPFAALMAGQHGLAMAARFCEKMPQLGGMVAARTHHLDRAILEFVAQGGRDVVLAGVGWDMRAYRLALPVGTRIFELDLPFTLAERHRRLNTLQIQVPHGVHRIEIPIDLRTQSLTEVLAPFRDTKTPVFIAWEGLSMYFQETEITHALRGMEPLLRHPVSRLWADWVHRRAIEAPEACGKEVAAFMRSMQLLGEPFIYGADGLDGLVANLGLHCREFTPSNTYLSDATDPIYAFYHFALISGAEGDCPDPVPRENSHPTSHADRLNESAPAERMGLDSKII